MIPRSRRGLLVRAVVTTLAFFVSIAGAQAQEAVEIDFEVTGSAVPGGTVQVTADVTAPYLDWVDAVISGPVSRWAVGILSFFGLAGGWVESLVVDGILAGVGAVLAFVPVLFALYLMLALLEDSGYMARAAAVMERGMRALGIPGKAFLPMMVGFGCTVPAIYATRTLDSSRDRLLTGLITPFMSCGARLPVYALFAAAFFPTNGQNLVFALYLTGIVIAVFTGLLMKRTILSGESSGFMMELPPYHLPTMKGILLRTWDRVRLFIKEAGQVIVIMVLVINVLSAIGTDGSVDTDNTDKSVLAAISKTATPVFAPMGIEEDNWPAVLGVISGVLAKEVVVGTLDTLYSQLARGDDQGAADEEAFDFWQAISDAAATVPENLAGVTETLDDPLQLDVGDISSLETAAEEQEVDNATFGAMVKRFDGQAGAFAYLLFILLYTPCVATIGAIRREAGPRWAAFVTAWTTIVAYITASAYYQVATFSQHTVFSSIWLAGSVLLLGAIIYGLRQWALKDTTAQVSTAQPDHP